MAGKTPGDKVDKGLELSVADCKHGLRRPGSSSYIYSQESLRKTPVLNAATVQFAPSGWGESIEVVQDHAT